MNKINQEKIDFIKNNLDMSNIELANILQIDRGTVRKYKKKEGVIYQPKNFHEYDDYIISHYYDMTSRQLADEIGCSDAYVSKVWNLAGLHGKGSYRYFCNQDYFEKIDSSNKAYILGFIAADGCVYKRNNHAGLLAFQIHKQDIEILKQIKEEMNCTHPINKHENMISLNIVNNKIFEDLGKIGLRPQKTWNINIKEIISHIPVNYIKDFFRGYFDGDGGISSGDQFKTISRTTVYYAVPEKSGLEFIDVLKKYNIICHYYPCPDDKYSHSFGEICFNNTTEKYVFLKWIYQNADTSIKLNRKFLRAQSFIKRVEKNETNRSENIKAIKYYTELMNDENENNN